MEKLIVFMMLLPFSLILLFQPSLDRVEETREKVVQGAIQRGVERAAVEGYFTNENIMDMVAILSLVGYNEEDIEFDVTLTPTPRGEYIEGAIKVPNHYQFLLFENIISGDITEKYHYHFASRMSEYVN
ncbi:MULTISPECIES: hypothetical protein [Bacillaceae]|uniref:Uncharacterized protein n=2 Tax=Bacillaceae TaxID=186817 RepID=A0A7V7RHZ1_9BACI|nr:MULTISPECIES: hypothetical protein [Bacillaceae]KAB2329450.1 hypothetical protein F7732_21230 [Bacillus mesophilum]QVY63940.1 hypothetical protein J1899_22465 [Cytobacillus gottheilii]